MHRQRLLVPQIGGSVFVHEDDSIEDNCSSNPHHDVILYFRVQTARPHFHIKEAQNTRHLRLKYYCADNRFHSPIER